MICNDCINYENGYCNLLKMKIEYYSYCYYYKSDTIRFIY